MNLADLTPRKKDSMLDALSEALRIVEELPTSTPCRLCEEWHEDQCGKYGALPPPEVQATGCEEWIEGIPF